MATGLPISQPSAMRIRFDRYVLDLGRGCLMSNEVDITLRPKTFEVLRFLVKNAGRLVSKNELITAVWPDVIVTEASIVQCVKELRRALGDDGERLIRTVSRRGYRLETTAAIEPVGEVSAVVGVPPCIRVESNENARNIPHEPHTADAGAKKRLRIWVVLSIAMFLTISFLWLWLRPGGETSVRWPALFASKPTIAVLPFITLSSDPGQSYFSDGLTEDLITDLSKVSGLLVIARNSSFAYRDKPADAERIGRELGAKYIVEGSIRRSGDQIRITAQLIDTNTGLHIWAERYDRELKEMFHLQDDILQAIVAAVAVKLLPSEIQRLARKPTNSIEAYDFWARGRELQTHMTVEENNLARQMFLHATAIDPSFARAYGQIANTYSVEVELGWNNSSVDEAIANSILYGQRAVALDEGLPEARWPLARAYAWNRQTERALAEIKQAVLLNPNYADGQAYYALLLTYEGRAREGLDHIEQGMRMNPQYPFWYRHNLGIVEFMLGRYNESASHFEEALERNPTWQPSRQMLIAAYGYLGRVDDAQWELEKLRVAHTASSLKEIRERAPYRNPADMSRLLDGWCKAGVTD